MGITNLQRLNVSGESHCISGKPYPGLQLYIPLHVNEKTWKMAYVVPVAENKNEVETERNVSRTCYKELLEVTRRTHIIVQ